MATYSSRAEWAAAQGAGGPELLYDFDATAAATSNLAGATTLGGLTVTESNTGSPTTWRILNGTGIELTGAGAVTGKLRIDWADIGADLMARALTNNDTIVIATQFVAAMASATATFTTCQHGVENTAVNNQQVASVLKEGANNRRVAHWNGSGLSYALRDNGSARSVATWFGADGMASVSYWSGSVLSTTEPLGAGTAYRVNGEAARVSATAPAWDKTAAGSWLIWNIARSAGETVATVLERLQIWLIPGSENV